VDPLDNGHFITDLYVAWYTPLFQAAPNTLSYLSAQVLAKGITNFLRSVAYNDTKWQVTLSASDEGFVNYVKEQNPTLYSNIYPYMARESEGGVLVSDEHGGLIDLKHLAATAEGYFTTSIAPDSWYGWAADLATAILDIVIHVFRYMAYGYLPYSNYCKVLKSA
jgi:hypothetical protein